MYSRVGGWNVIPNIQYDCWCKEINCATRIYIVKQNLDGKHLRGRKHEDMR